MKKLWLGLMMAAATTVMVAACKDATTFAVCVAGESQACAGVDSCDGFQVCNVEGSAFGECQCGGGGNGGAGASGGMGPGPGGMGPGPGGMGPGPGGMGPGGAGGGNPMDCPDMTPMEGEMCVAAGQGPLFCDYDDITCRCGQNNPAWNCYTCPDMAPMAGGVCPVDDMGARCEYADSLCRCNGANWNCFTCPDVAPTGACNGLGGFSCDYDNATCTCQQGMWNCN